MSGGHGHVVRLLDADPDLAQGLSPEAHRLAGGVLQARVAKVPTGAWNPPTSPPAAAGLLLLDGLMVRKVRLGRSLSAELVGPGDVLRPGEEDAGMALVPAVSEWRVLKEARVAVIDARLTAALGHWPELTAALCTRFLRRSRSLAFLMAAQHFTRVSDRLLASLWHMASMWGRVTPKGTVVPFRLTHEMLGEIIGARRPTTTQAILSLERQGLVMRDKRRFFVLLGDPPIWEDRRPCLAAIEV